MKYKCNWIFIYINPQVHSYHLICSRTFLVQQSGLQLLAVSLAILCYRILLDFHHIQLVEFQGIRKRAGSLSHYRVNISEKLLYLHIFCILIRVVLTPCAVIWWLYMRRRLPRIHAILLIIIFRLRWKNNKIIILFHHIINT